MEQEYSSFFSQGLEFSCKRCSSCCCGVPGVVFLSDDELDALCKHEKLTREQFISVYCRWVPLADGFDYLSFRETSAYECIFWEDGIGCRVYELRPVQCRTYPFWTQIIRSKEAWCAEGKKCPGIGSGFLHTEEEILSQEGLYRSRALVKRPHLRA